jgi:beta-lactamase regulating signal transducer with metallopeptidase domain/Flp pilus assembly protein TadD
VTAHLLSCTLSALVAVTATLWLRGQRASWRHAILFLAMLRFAIPTSWLNQAGEALVRVAPTAPHVHAAEDLRRLLLGPGIQGQAPMMGSRPSVLPYRMIWIAGSLVCFGMWVWKARRRIREARPANEVETEAFGRAVGTTRVGLRIVSEDLVPGAWGLWRPEVILPEGLSAQLNEAELEAVIAHEVAHVLRRDNLMAAIAHAIVSVFWFHPLLWWTERRMLAEREAACDEMVLSRGVGAPDYAAAILKVCRMPFADTHGYAGATGFNLEHRMEYIMNLNLNRPSSRVARALPAVLFAFAVLLPAAGGYLKAQDKPAAVQPAESEARYQKGVDLLQQKKYAAAEQAFREALELNPKNTRALMGQVEVLVADKRPQEAIDLLQGEVTKYPERVDLRLALGNAAVRAGQYDVALTAYQDVLPKLNQDPQAQADLYLRIGETYRRKGDVEKAVSNLKQAQGILPESVTIAGTLAIALDAGGQRGAAEESYRGVLKLDPNNAVAMNNLAYLLSENGGDLDEALSLAQKARKTQPEMTEISDTVGWIYLKKGSPDDAIAAFDTVVQKDPRRAEYHYHLAMALTQKGDKFAAAQQLKTALSCSPSETEAAKIRELLEKTLQ